MTKVDLLTKEPRSETLAFLDDFFEGKKFSLLSLAGDASSRKYYRVVCQNQSLVLMVWDPFTNTQDYPFLNILKHFQKNGVQVPNVMATSPERGLVLLEDLGDLTLERKFWEWQDQGPIVPYYKLALDELIKIHFDATQDQTPCVAFENTFNEEKLHWELNYGKTHLFEKLLGLQLSSSEQAALQSIFSHISSQLAKQPQHLCHRDYHSRNLMITLGKLRVIDFQDARLGPIHYDLVSLLHDSYVQLQPKTQQTLLNYYLEKIQTKYGYSYDQPSFEIIYKVQTIQRTFKACGSFASFFNLRGDKRYLKYIKPTMSHIVKVLRDFPEYKLFLEIIENKGVLDFNYDSHSIKYTDPI